MSETRGPLSDSEMLTHIENCVVGSGPSETILAFDEALRAALARAERAEKERDAGKRLNQTMLKSLDYTKDQLFAAEAQNAALRGAFTSHLDTMGSINAHLGYPFSQLLINAREKLKELPPTELGRAVRGAVEALEYYGVEDHYEETLGFTETRKPGVLNESGNKARQALSALRKAGYP